MAIAQQRPLKTWESKAPATIRHVMKPRVKFLCTDCFQEKETWRYMIGFNPFNQREVCATCWCASIVPPMKPVGYGVIYNVEP